MMRKLIGLCIAILFLQQQATAQETAKLTVPSSPAFSILNFEPSAVMRPVNARDLAADVLNSFDENGRLLLNLGLEVMPYWLSSHPTLTRSKYLHPSIGQTFLQSLSISAATVKDTLTNSNKLGAGFRFKILNGRPTPELDTANAYLKTNNTVVAIINGVKAVVGPVINTRQKAVGSVLSALIRADVPKEIISAVERDANELNNNFSDSPADLKEYLDQLLIRRVDSYTKLASEVSEMLYRRRGLILEFAGASGFNTSKNNSLERIGIWSNLSYNVSKDDLFTLTARFMDQSSDTVLRNLDIGLGFLKKANRYNVSLESMWRCYWAEVEVPTGNQSRQIKRDFTYRVAFQSSYMFNEHLSINISMGKDFNSPFVSGSGFFSIFGFNYSFFNKKPSDSR